MFAGRPGSPRYVSFYYKWWFVGDPKRSVLLVFFGWGARSSRLGPVVVNVWI